MRTEGALVFVAVLLAVCAAPAPSPMTTNAGSPLPWSPSPGSNPVSERPALPAGFPVVPDAIALPLPDAASDPTLAARWRVVEGGAATFAFYASALPEAGFAVEGLFPGGGGAVITCRDRQGVAWQVVVTGTSPTIVEVRLDIGR